MGLSSKHIEALDCCYSEPLPVQEIGADADWWHLLFELRDNGLVTFDDNSTEVQITDAGRAALDEPADEDGESEVEDPAVGYPVGYISFLDTFFDEPVPAYECREWWSDVETMISNGHLSGPDDDGLLHITETGSGLLGAVDDLQ